MMKTRNLCALFLAVVCALSLGAPAYARASAQIKTYNINAVSTGGQIAIRFSVAGTSEMENVGCESIRIYELTSYGRKEVVTLDENDLGMSVRNQESFRNTIYQDVESGVQYLVYVTVFAEDENGRDTRDREFNITGR